MPSGLAGIRRRLVRGSIPETTSRPRTPLALAPARTRVVVEGRVVSVSVRSRSANVPATVVDLERGGADGSRGSTTLVWLGRRGIAGIEPGSTVRAHGLLTNVKGQDTLYNPRYELLPMEGAR